MTFKSIVLTVVAAVLLTAGGMFGYFYIIHDNSSTPPKEEVDLPLESFVNTQNNNSNLEVKSAQDPQSNNQSQNQLLGPSQFSAYEQYAQAETTQYIDTLIGNGEEAVIDSTVHMLYKGYLTDGTLFDQNRTNELNQIVTFPFKLGGGQVITGWEQGIAGMKEGGKRRLIIPARLGYGESGTPDGSIPPNSMLIFDVELVQVDLP